MRQEQEQFRSFDRGLCTNPPRGWDLIDTSGVTPSTESREAFRLREVRFGIHQEDNKGEREKEIPQEQKTDGFEPFLNPEFKEEDLFVNNYGGDYAQKMGLNRKGVERALHIAHLEGKVFLTNLQPNRSRVEAQGNELAAKRFLIFGEKEKVEEEENPFRRVVSVPEGWRIEINDTRITEELTAERKLSGKELQRVFINKFNSQLRKGLKECVWREKCSSVKDEKFETKLISTFLGGTAIGLTSIGAAFNRGAFIYSVLSVSAGMSLWAFYILNSLPDGRKRPINHPLENFMPPLEIDRVGRTFAYLAGKGRTLVREKKE